MSFVDLVKSWSGKYITKAANIDTGNSGNTGLQLVTGDTLKKDTLTPKDLVNLNKHWIYACNNRIAQTLAQNQLHLYTSKSKSSKMLNASKSAKTTKQIQLSDNEEIVEIINHPFLDLMQNINSSMNYFDFAVMVQNYLGLIGNAYVQIIKGNNGMPVELQPLLSEDVSIQLDKPDGVITGYKYHKEFISTDDMLHFVNYNPGSRISGRGELEACIDAALLYQYYMDLEAYMCKNNARPDFALTYKSMLNEKEQKDLERILRKKFSGKNAGLPLVTGDATITTLGFAPRDMQFEKGREWCKKEILSCYGVPDTLLTLSESNWASAKEGIRIFNELTVYPKLIAYCEKMTEKLLPMYDSNSNMFVWYTTMEDENDPLKQAQVLKTYVESGIMDVNEARSVLLLDPIEEPEDIKEEVNN